MEPIKPKDTFEQELKSMGFAQQVINQLKEVTNDLPTAIELGFTLQEEYNIQNQNNSNMQLQQYQPFTPIQFQEEEEYKMVIVVRRDLKMSVGKVCAQVGHGDAVKRFPKNVENYQKHGTPKVVLKVQSEQDLIDVYENAKQANIPCCLIIDAGRTQIPPNSKTVVGLGPGNLKSQQKIN